MSIRISKKLIVILLLLSLILSSGCEKDIAITGASSQVEEYIREEFRLLPEIYQKKLLKEGWEIEVIEGEVEDIYKDNLSNDVTGLTDISERKIYLEETDPEVILHELCHAMIFDAKSGSSEYIKYEEIESEIEIQGLDPYIKENYDEYIVEMMAGYITDKSSLDEYPITRKTVEEMLSSTDWM